MASVADRNRAMTGDAQHEADRAGTGVRERTTECGNPQLVVTLMCLVVALVFASGTVLFTALPEIASQLGATQTDAQWLANAYPLVIAALLMPAGALIDRYGRKRGCLLGLVLLAGFFFAASQVQTAATAIWLLAAAGIGGALAFPATLAMITAVLPRDRRGTAIGIWSASMLGGGSVGAAGGGVLIDVASRSWVFAAPAIVAALLLVPTARCVPESRDEEGRPLDVDGAVLSALGVGLLVLGLTYAPTRGFGDPLTLSMFAGLLFLLLFVRWSLVSPNPLFDVRLLTHGRFGMGSFVNVLTWFVGYGGFFLAVQYRSYTLGYGPLLTGLSLFPLMVLIIPLGAVGPRLARTYGARLIMVIGMLMLAGGAAYLAWAATTETFWWVALGEMITFGGLGLCGGPATEAIVDGLPVSEQGVASAVNDTTREVGVALGVATLGSLFNVAYRRQIDESSTALPEQALHVTKDSAAAGLQVAAGLPGRLAAEQTEVIRSAAASGLSLAMLVAAGILTLSACVVWRCHPADRPAAAPTAARRSKREMRARIADLESELQAVLAARATVAPELAESTIAAVLPPIPQPASARTPRPRTTRPSTKAPPVAAEQHVDPVSARGSDLAPPTKPAHRSKATHRSSPAPRAPRNSGKTGAGEQPRSGTAATP